MRAVEIWETKILFSNFFLLVLPLLFFYIPFFLTLTTVVLVVAILAKVYKMFKKNPHISKEALIYIFFLNGDELIKIGPSFNKKWLEKFLVTNFVCLW